MKSQRFIGLAVAGYLVFGLAWIGMSHQLLPELDDKDLNLRLSLAKGVLFVLATGAMFFLALRAVATPSAAPPATQGLLSDPAWGPFADGRQRWLPYAVAVGMSLLMLVVREQIALPFGDRPLLVLFVLPIILSAMMGGAAPGLLATAICALGVNYLAIPPVGSLKLNAGADTFPWLVLIVNGVIVSVLAHLLRTALWQAKTDRLLLRALISSTPDAITVKDRQGCYRMGNPVVASILGIPLDRVVGQHASAFLSPAEAAHIEASDQAVMASGQPSVFEHAIATPLGLRYFQSTRGPLVGPDGEVLGVFGMSRDITERRLAVQALEQSEARLRLALDAVRDGLWDWDLRSGQVFRSPRCDELMAREADDDRGGVDFLLSGVDAEDLPRVRAAIDAHLDRSLDRIDIEFRLNAPAAAGRWLALRGRAVERDAEGAPLRLVGTLSEVSERRQRDTLIRELSQLVEQSPDSVFITDPAGRIGYVNDALVALQGGRRDDLVGAMASALPLEEPVPEAVQARSAALERGLPWRGELRFRHEDGSAADLAVVVCPIQDSDGSVTHHAWILRDISERKRTEHELARHHGELERRVEKRTSELVIARDRLAERERFIRAIADAVPGMVGYWDAELRCRFGNAAYRRWFGKTPEQMLGLSMRELLGEELFQKNEMFITGALSGQVQLFQRTLQRVDGSLGDTLVSYVPDVMNGRVQGFTAVVTDVSELKHAEVLLAQLNEQLAQRAAEAEEATRAKSAFLANMSHEIRTPMNAIIGLNHLLARDATDALQQDRLSKVDDAARHLLQVINDILDLSKIEAGKMNLERKEFLLDEVLGRSSDIVRSRAVDKGLALIVDCDHVPQRMIGDPTRLSQVLINLLSNAVKFTSTGWVRLHARLTRRDGDRLFVRFEVQDTGPGIPEDQQARLFETFEQGDSSTTRQHGGTGLGLALTRRFAALMGGEAGVSSSVGVGSTFWFTAEFERAAGDSTPQPKPSLQGLRVLLVGDLPEAREALGDRLGLFGMRVDSRADGETALNLLEHTARSGQAFDLLVVDCHLPGMDGLALIDQARQVLGGGMPPTVLVTAPDDASLWADGRGSTVSAILVKPVMASALADCLAQVLHRSGQPSGARPPAQAEALLRSLHAGRRILVVEDNPINQEIALEILTAAGLVVDAADDGQRAVALASERDYALILMDMQMPVLDGLDATRAIRRRLGPDLPIVAMTANAFGDDLRACLDAGMNDHLAKPVDPDCLYRTLLRWLPGSASAAAAAAAAPSDPQPGSGVPAGVVTLLPLAERLAQLPGWSYSQGLASAGGDLDSLVRVLQVFIASYRDGDGALQAAAARGDLAAIGRAAHSIRGACAAVGASTAADLARALETQAAGECDPQALAADAQRLSDELQGLVAAMARALSQ